MRVFADLHIHSRYSRATSRSLNLKALAESAKIKGINVIGTGDFTHPSWLEEIEAELKEAGNGLLIHPDYNNIYFMLTAEVSTIYKQGDKTRKVHHLLGAPDIETAKKISRSLAEIGNIKSDGRPIVGMSSRNLLELVLTAGSEAFVVPAHIWTPWFSALGSKSGFDSITECYLDLSDHIFACETGLSSDPAMNRMVKSLDRFSLVSNSDAHSADRIGREATIFDCEPSYQNLLNSMKTGNGLCGTVEFYPEEGKYHLDGHRDCGVVLEPEETVKLGGRCPVCQKPVTMGVKYRVHELSDRREDASIKDKPYYSVIPLKEILGELLDVGRNSVRVEKYYENLISLLGPELDILICASIEDITKAADDRLGQAVLNMRSGKVYKNPGYDGVFGTISILSEKIAKELKIIDISAVPPIINDKKEEFRTEQLKLF